MLYNSFLARNRKKYNMLEKDSKIFVAGHHGLVGSAIWNNLKNSSGAKSSQALKYVFCNYKGA